uniref:Uncharacterized protein n=1 Tax=Lygus hesperus TaxID=30085 RepID=A0A146KVP1_LYGHE
MEKENPNVAEAIVEGLRRIEGKLDGIRDNSKSRSRSRLYRSFSRSPSRSRRRRSPRRARRDRSYSSSYRRSSYDRRYTRSPTPSPRRKRRGIRRQVATYSSRSSSPYTRPTSPRPIPTRSDHDYCAQDNMEVTDSAVGSKPTQGEDPTSETPPDVIHAEVTGDDVINLEFSPILELLGKDPEENPVRDFVLHEQVVPRWRHALLYGIPKEEVKNLLSKHTAPNNLSELIPPPVNPEVKVNLPKNILIKDLAQIELQTQLAGALNALGGNMNTLLDPKTEIPNDLRKSLMANNIDAAKFAANTFFKISINRRNTMYPYLHQNVREQCDKLPPTQLLFGLDLSEKIKSVKLLQAASRDLKPPTSNTFAKPKTTSFTQQSERKKGGERVERRGTYNQGNYSRPSRQQPRQTTTYKGQTSTYKPSTSQRTRDHPKKRQ